VGVFVNFVQWCRRIGITVPVVPGIMLIQVITHGTVSSFDILRNSDAQDTSVLPFRYSIRTPLSFILKYSSRLL
jgi:hypothetical protein